MNYKYEITVSTNIEAKQRTVQNDYLYSKTIKQIAFIGIIICLITLFSLHIRNYV
jgi:hypothetical protein